MQLHDDLDDPCDSFQGQRYNQESLQILYRGKNISEVHNLTVEESLHYFEAIPAIERRLQNLKEVGLSYIRLGQNATTPPAGEAQRIKLAYGSPAAAPGQALTFPISPTPG